MKPTEEKKETRNGSPYDAGKRKIGGAADGPTVVYEINLKKIMY